MQSFEKLLLENKAWAEEVKDRDPGYFERLAAALDALLEER